MNTERGGEDISLVEEEEFISRPSSEYLNEKYYSVGEFDASTCSGYKFYDIYYKEEEIITEGSIVWLNTNKNIGKEGSLKPLSVIFQRMPNIWNLYGLVFWWWSWRQVTKKKYVFDLASRVNTFVWKCIEAMITSDDSGKKEISLY